MFPTNHNKASYVAVGTNDDSDVYDGQTATFPEKPHVNAASITKNTAYDIQWPWDAQSFELEPFPKDYRHTHHTGKAERAALIAGSGTSMKVLSHYRSSSFSEQEGPDRTRQPDFGKSTRNWCFMGLAVALCTAIASIVGGAISYSRKGLVYGSSGCLIGANEGDGILLLAVGDIWNFLPQLLTVTLVTMLNESIGFAHTIAHRWSLFKEQRLAFHTNLRLFSASKTNFANRWYMNILQTICFVLSYSAATQLFGLNSIVHSGNSAKMCTAENDKESFPALVLNGLIAFFLGGSLLVETAIAAFAVYGARNTVLTWSSNPINAALASSSNLNSDLLRYPVKRLMRTPGRSMVGSSDTVSRKHLGYSAVAEPEKGSFVALPRRQKQSMSGCSHRTLRIVYLLWATCVATLLWTIAIIILSLTYGKSIHGQGLRYLAVLHIFRAVRTSSESQLILFALGTAVQTYLTLALACTELLINMARDEAFWSKTASSSGGKLETNAIRSAFTTWTSLFLFVFKTLIHFFFGEAVALTLYMVQNIDMEHGSRTDIEQGATYFMISGIPLTALTGTTFLLALFGTYIVKRKLKGPQPETYGHLQTLVNLIDDYGRQGEALFWGDKGLHEPTEDDGRLSKSSVLYNTGNQALIRRAGTSGKKELVGKIQMDAMYS